MRLRRPRLAAVLALNLVFCLGTTGIATAADPPTLWEEPLFEGKLVNGPRRKPRSRRCRTPKMPGISRRPS